MRAVFIVIALRPSETNETSFQSSVQGPQLCLCVTHSFAESWESRKARKKSQRGRGQRGQQRLFALYLHLHAQHTTTGFQTFKLHVIWFVFPCASADHRVWSSILRSSCFLHFMRFCLFTSLTSTANKFKWQWESQSQSQMANVAERIAIWVESRVW